MSNLLIGTDEGVFSLSPDGGDPDLSGPIPSGPPSVSWIAWGASSAYAVTRDGALWEETGDDSWRLVNERPVQEEIWTFAADPRVEGRLYLGVSPAMLYISDDAGNSWRACESLRDIPGYEKWTFPPPPHIPHVRSIAPDPDLAGAVYVGVEVGGLYYTADNGETWESLNEGLYWDVHVVCPEPDTSNVYAATGTGFHRSEDGGRHWTHVQAGLDRSYTHPLVVVPNRKGLLFVAAAATPPPGWQPHANAAIYRSEDGGKNWSQLTQGLPPQFDEMVRPMAVGDTGKVYAAAGRQLFASPDEGNSWRAVAQDLPTVRALVA